MKQITIMALCALIGVMGAKGATCSTCTQCEDTEKVTSCIQKFTGKSVGKVACGDKTGTTKSIGSLKVKSCSLTIVENEPAKIVLSGTKNGVSFNKELSCTEFSWNVFGKKMEKALAGSKKAVSLNSSICFAASDEDGTIKVHGVLLGSVSAKNVGTECEPRIVYTPGKFSGNFNGWASAEGCECFLDGTSALGCRTVETCTACGGTSTSTVSDCLDFVATENDEKIECFFGNITVKWDKNYSGCKAR